MFSGFLIIDDKKITKHIFLCFLAVFLANFFLKIVHLDFSSFWYDEIISVKSAQEDFGHIKHVSEWDKNPPFYYYCLWVWIKLFGNSVFAVRLLSVIFSSLAASVLFVFVNKFFNYKAALFASVFFISSNLLFFYAHEARAYSLVVLLSLLSACAFFSALRSGKIYLFLLLGLLNFLLVYSHYVSGLVWLFEAITVVFFYRRYIKWFSLSTLIIALLVFIRFTKKQCHLIFDFNAGTQDFWLQKSSTHYLKEVIETFFSNNNLLSLVLIALYMSAAVYLLINKRRTDQPVLYFTLMAGAGSIVLLFFLGKITPIFLDRYILFSIPFLFIIPAYFLSQVKYVAITIPLVALFGIMSFIKIDFATQKSMDYKNAIGFIKTVKDQSTLVVVSTRDIAPLFSYYYERTIFSQKNYQEVLKDQHVFFANTKEDLPGNFNGYDRIIHVSSFNEYTDGSLAAFLKSKGNVYNVIRAYRGVTITELIPVKQR